VVILRFGRPSSDRNLTAGGYRTMIG